MPWTTPVTVNTGQTISAALWNEQIRDNMNEIAPFFGAWTTWTPKVYQNGERTITNTQSRYLKVGRLVHVYSAITITNTGLAGQRISITLPFAAAREGDLPVGTFFFMRASNGARYLGFALVNSTFGASPGIIFHVAGDIDVLGADPSFAVANGDTMRFSLTYEATS